MGSGNVFGGIFLPGNIIFPGILCQTSHQTRERFHNPGKKKNSPPYQTPHMVIVPWDNSIKIETREDYLGGG